MAFATTPRSKNAALIIGVGLLAWEPAWAAGPVAIVEDVANTVAGLQPMDYVDAGQRISLGPNDTIVLGYLQSCVREVIRGGAIVVGAHESTVSGAARIERQKTPCDGAKLHLTAAQAGKGGVMVFRAPAKQQAGDAQARATLPEPQLTLYGLSPIFDLGDRGAAVVERLDRPGERHEIRGETGRNGARFHDFAKKDSRLAPGGLYRATTGDTQVVFKIDPFAEPGSTALAGRLIRF